MPLPCSTLWLLALAALAACARPTAAAPRDDLLVLEVGGGQGSLRQALVAAGAVAPVDPAAQEPTPTAPVAPREEQAPPAPPPANQPAPTHITVELGRGETLIHLAKRYLGDGNRFREILAANDWTERDARRLPAGQLVKVPVDPANPPR